MLVLSRKLGETIQIGPNVTLKVVELRGDRVKLAFEAPTSVPIHRSEVYRQILLESHDSVRLRPPNESKYYSEFA